MVGYNIPPLVNQGDLWRLGDHFVYCGNSLTTGSFEVVMQGEKAQIIITDPPYNCPINGHVCGLGKIKHDEFENVIIYRWRQETGKTAKLVKNYKELENDVR